MLVHLKRGLVENFYVSQEEPVSVTNIKRSLLAQLQLDVSGYQLSSHETNRLSIGGGAPSGEVTYFDVVEETLHGQCQTNYNIYPLPEARSLELEQAWETEETDAHLPVSVHGKAACQGKKYWEIVKTRNLDHCHFSPVAQRFAGAETNADATTSNIGTIYSVSI
jgi:hypothetical protein